MTLRGGIPAEKWQASSENFTLTHYFPHGNWSWQFNETNGQAPMLVEGHGCPDRRPTPRQSAVTLFLVNIIPLIAKADTMTPDECDDFKKEILREIETHKINIYEFPDHDDEEENRFVSNMTNCL